MGKQTGRGTALPGTEQRRLAARGVQAGSQTWITGPVAGGRHLHGREGRRGGRGHGLRVAALEQARGCETQSVRAGTGGRGGRGLAERAGSEMAGREGKDPPVLLLPVFT